MINYTAFDQKSSLKTNFLKALKDSTRGLSRAGLTALAVVAGLLIGLIVLLVIRSAATQIIHHGSMPSAILLLPFIAIAIPAGLMASHMQRQGKRTLQLEQFCQDNSFRFLPNTTMEDKLGSLFQTGRLRMITNHISGTVSHGEFQLYDYNYTQGIGRDSKTYYFGVAEITLKRKFPHIVIDSKQNGSIEGFSFDRTQKIELEGNFGKHFTIYGPKEYEIEVLQILNPSVMSTLLDLGEPFDVEIIGDKLYIYNQGTMNKKRIFQAIFSAIDQISTSTKSVQESFTMPEQIGDNRPVLKRSFWPAAIAMISMLLLYAAFYWISTLINQSVGI